MDMIPGLPLYQIVRIEIALAWVAIVVVGLVTRRLIKRWRTAEFVMWCNLLGGVGSTMPTFLPAFWTEWGPKSLDENAAVVLAYWFIAPFVMSLLWLPAWLLALGWFSHVPETSQHLLQSLQIGVASGVMLGFLMTATMRAWDRRSAANRGQS